jgi:hypothetical protein
LFVFGAKKDASVRCVSAGVLITFKAFSCGKHASPKPRATPPRMMTRVARTVKPRSTVARAGAHACGEGPVIVAEPADRLEGRAGAHPGAIPSLELGVEPERATLAGAAGTCGAVHCGRAVDRFWRKRAIFFAAEVTRASSKVSCGAGSACCCWGSAAGDLPQHHCCSDLASDSFDSR